MRLVSILEAKHPCVIREPGFSQAAALATDLRATPCISPEGVQQAAQASAIFSQGKWPPLNLNSAIASGEML